MCFACFVGVGMWRSEPGPFGPFREVDIDATHKPMARAGGIILYEVGTRNVARFVPVGSGTDTTVQQ